jgi:hypothetical protein
VIFHCNYLIVTLHFSDRVRRHSSVPLAAGFGFSTPEHCKEVSNVAEGIDFREMVTNHLLIVTVQVLSLGQRLSTVLIKTKTKLPLKEHPL